MVTHRESELEIAVTQKFVGTPKVNKKVRKFAIGDYVTYADPNSDIRYIVTIGSLPGPLSPYYGGNDSKGKYGLYLESELLPLTAQQSAARLAANLKKLVKTPIIPPQLVEAGVKPVRLVKDEWGHVVAYYQLGGKTKCMLLPAELGDNLQVKP